MRKVPLNLTLNSCSIYEINWNFLQEVSKKFPGDMDRIRRMSLIEERGDQKVVRMGYLAVVGSRKVNGVAVLHSGLVQTVLFKDFVEVVGIDRFTNVTNGKNSGTVIREAQR